MRIWRKWRNPTIKPPFGARVDWSDPITQGLVGCWLFNEFCGMPLDVASNELSDLVGCEWEDTISLNGSGDYIKIDYVVRKLANKFTVVSKFAGVVSDTGPSGYGRNIVSFHDRTFGNVARFCVKSGYANIDDGNTLVGSIPLFDYELENVTYWADGGRYRIYVDGKYDSGVTFSTPDIPDDGFASIGQEYDADGKTSDFFRGKIYHVLIFSRALSDSEIERLYHEPYSFFLAPFPVVMVDLGAGQSYTQSVSGSISPTGSLNGRYNAGEVCTGGVSPGGALSLAVEKGVKGALSAAGDLVRSSGVVLEGAVANAGSLVAEKQSISTFQGSCGASGALAFNVQRVRSYGGAVAPVGDLQLQVHKGLGGSVRPSGVALNDQTTLGGSEDKLIGSRLKETTP